MNRLLKSIVFRISIFGFALSCFAGQVLIGGDSASGRNSSELPGIYGQIQPAIVRAQAGGWRALEPAPGVYDWTMFDKMLVQNTVTSLCAYASNYAWLSNAPQPLLMFCVVYPPPFYTNSQAAFIGGETNFVKALLRHAPPHSIQIVEFINEPGGGYSWIPGCTNWQQIAAFTGKLATAVGKVVHPLGVKLAGPSLTMPFDDNFFSVFAANGGFKACNIVTFHDYRMTGTGWDNAQTYSPYEPYGNAPNLVGCIANCNKWSGGKPICVSELGLGTPENVIAYCIIAQRKGVWSLCPTYWLGGSTNLYECGDWDWLSFPPFGSPQPKGAAFLATVRALNQKP
jgi:hypothetical protein